MKRCILLFCLVVLSIIQLRAKEPLLTYEQLAAKLGIKELHDDAADEHVVTNRQLLGEISHQLHLKNIDRVGLYFQYAPISLSQKIELVSQILSNKKYGFTPDESLQLVLAVANGYDVASSDQQQFLDILLSFPDLLQKSNPLFIAAHNNYQKVLSALLPWSTKLALAKPELKKTLEEMRYRALVRAVQEGDAVALKSIDTFAEHMSPKDASSLVWYVAHVGKGASVIAELKKLGADLNSLYQGKTPMIEAIIQKHADVVYALIDAGADVNALGDLSIGSPLQQAIEKRDPYIERMLRKAGAHE